MYRTLTTASVEAIFEVLTTLDLQEGGILVAARSGIGCLILHLAMAFCGADIMCYGLEMDQEKVSKARDLKQLVFQACLLHQLPDPV